MNSLLTNLYRRLNTPKRLDLKNEFYLLAIPALICGPIYWPKVIINGKNS